MTDLVAYVLTGLGIGRGFALVGSGIVLIYRVTRVVNFAQGAFAVLAAMTASTLLAADLPHGVAEILAVAVAAGTGLLVGVVAIGKPGTTPGASLIITLGLGVFAYAVEVLVWGDQPRSFAGCPGAIDIGGARVQAHYLLIIGVTVPVFVALAVFFARTDLGKALSACASNRYAARVVGIDVTRMGLLSFALGGALGGLAGCWSPRCSRSRSTPTSRSSSTVRRGDPRGLTRPAVTLAGGLLLGVGQTMIAGYIGGRVPDGGRAAPDAVRDDRQAARRSTLQEESA
jgi:branched-chain amino acid transport system permease protein